MGVEVYPLHKVKIRVQRPYPARCMVGRGLVLVKQQTSSASEPLWIIYCKW